MVSERAKPRYFGQMESGVLFLWPREIHMGKDMVFKVGISQQSQERPQGHSAHYRKTG